MKIYIPHNDNASDEERLLPRYKIIGQRKISRNKLLLLMLIIYSIILVIFYDLDGFLQNCNIDVLKRKRQKDVKFLVSSQNCKMLDLDPFNDEAMKVFSRQKYRSCSNKDLLSYVKYMDNNTKASLFINDKRTSSYSANGVNCCCSTVTRAPNTTHPDDHIKISECKSFSSNVSLHQDPVLVKCYDRKKMVYENVHQAFIINEEVQKKIDNFVGPRQKPSILFVGIDSVSRLNFIRSMPETRQYLENTGWLTLEGYNKIGDNTFPSFMAIFAGMNISRTTQICNPVTVGGLDRCPLIWKQFAQLGYITAYAEDEYTVSTFNYHKAGFKIPPTDFYLRLYSIAMETLKIEKRYTMNYCTGPESSGERIMNMAKAFAVTFRNYSSFGFFWMNSFSHNILSAPSTMDERVVKLFLDLQEKGVLEESVVIFLSDHGMRFGDIRLTFTGWLEERLPFLYVWFPEWFKRKYPKEVENFKANMNRLTSPYDLHITLQQILHMAGRKEGLLQAEACPKCKSLFEVMDENRSCEEAGIEPHWCTCYGYEKAEFSNDLKTKISIFVVDQIHKIIKSRNHQHKCAKYTVDKILDFRVAQNTSIVHEMFVVVQIQLMPKALVETTVSFEDSKCQHFEIRGGISRLDRYSEGSKCVNDSTLQMYCSCTKNGEIL